MRIKLICGKTMRAAMLAVSEQLGEDALILSTRSIGSLGFEITAALEVDALDTEISYQDSVVSELREEDHNNLFSWHGVKFQDENLSHLSFSDILFRNVDIKPSDGPIIVCGPQGGGKSVYIARLAARMVLDGKNPLIITVDNEKDGAVEQLAVCTRLLKIDLVAADTTDLVSHICEKNYGIREILIDTPGVSNFDFKGMNNLLHLKNASKGELLLVHPAGGDVDDTREAIRRYRELGVTRMVISKVDDARRLGGVLHAAIDGIALAEAGMSNSIINGSIPLNAISLHEIMSDRRDFFPPQVPKEISREVKGPDKDLSDEPRSSVFLRQNGAFKKNVSASGAVALTKHIAAQALRNE